jgi:hypothetical protein
LRDPISKKTNTKRAGSVDQGVGPEFKPQFHKKKTNKKTHPEVDWRCASSDKVPAL